MKKVLIPTRLDPIAREILEQNGNYQVVQDDTTPLPALSQQHPDTYALMVRSEKIAAEDIDRLPALKVIVRAGSGYNTIDTEHARQKGVNVMNTPGANANAVAEEVIALILADARHLIEAHASAASGKWEKKRFMGRELTGKTVGIVGLGNTGRLVARRLSGFEVRVLGYDPVISRDRAEEMSVELVDLPTLFSVSDYITLHIPENDETRGMVNASLLGRVRAGATLINCARAGILDEQALRAAKREKGLRFLNDVYPKDAEGPKSVADIADIMMPHLGASTHEANLNAARRAAEQLIDFDEKGITSFIVNRNIPDGLDEAYCDLANTLARLARCLLGRTTQLKLIETSFYGSLQPFSDWLLVPIVAGIWDDFDRGKDFQAARAYLRDMGIEYTNRATDPGKRFQNSITVDLTGRVDAQSLRSTSIRGTVTEGNLMVSRINDFDKLYFEPSGHTLLFQYVDRPGVIGRIGVTLAEAKINIEDIRHSHNPKTGQSLAIMRIDKKVPDEVVETITQRVDRLTAHNLSF